jgi:hypothetical protein
MKAREVMKLLNICRTTLYHYTKNNIIKHTKLSNGYYDHNNTKALFRCRSVRFTHSYLFDFLILSFFHNGCKLL